MCAAFFPRFFLFLTLVCSVSGAGPIAMEPVENRSCQQKPAFILDAYMIKRDVADMRAAQYDFSYSYTDPLSANADDYIVSHDNAELYSEGTVHIWKPVAGAESYALTPPAKIVYRFGFDKAVAEAKLYATVASFHWYYSRGHTFLYASKDGANWVKLAEAEPPLFGAATSRVYNALLPETLLGAKELWVKAELYSYGEKASIGGVWVNTAQHSRYDTSSSATTFALDVNLEKTSLERSVEYSYQKVEGFFIHYGDGAYDWIYITPNASLLAKLTGMEVDTGYLTWEILDTSSFSKISPCPDGTCVTFGTTTSASAVAKAVAGKQWSVNGHFMHYGSGAYEWLYMTPDKKLLARLTGMDSGTGYLTWELLDTDAFSAITRTGSTATQIGATFGPLSEGSLYNGLCKMPVTSYDDAIYNLSLLSSVENDVYADLLMIFSEDAQKPLFDKSVSLGETDTKRATENLLRFARAGNIYEELHACIEATETYMDNGAAAQSPAARGLVKSAYDFFFGWIPGTRTHTRELIMSNVNTGGSAVRNEVFETFKQTWPNREHPANADAFFTQLQNGDFDNDVNFLHNTLTQESGDLQQGTYADISNGAPGQSVADRVVSEGVTGIEKGIDVYVDAVGTFEGGAELAEGYNKSKDFIDQMDKISKGDIEGLLTDKVTGDVEDKIKEFIGDKTGLSEAAVDDAYDLGDITTNISSHIKNSVAAGVKNIHDAVDNLADWGWGLLATAAEGVEYIVTKWDDATGQPLTMVTYVDGAAITINIPVPAGGGDKNVTVIDKNGEKTEIKNVKVDEGETTSIGSSSSSSVAASSSVASSSSVSSSSSACPSEYPQACGDMCILASDVCCADGAGACMAGSQCCEGGCCPVEATCCGSGCCPAGATCYGGGVCCADGWVPCSGGCMPEGSVCCANGWCPAGTVCGGDTCL